jgi:hypothetical protein
VRLPVEMFPDEMKFTRSVCVLKVEGITKVVWPIVVDRDDKPS